MDQFLDLAARHRIGVMFVLFDGVWDPFPKSGKQREPRGHTSTTRVGCKAPDRRFSRTRRATTN